MPFTHAGHRIVLIEFFLIILQRPTLSSESIVPKTARHERLVSAELLAISPELSRERLSLPVSSSIESVLRASDTFSFIYSSIKSS